MAVKMEGAEVSGSPLIIGGRPVSGVHLGGRSYLLVRPVLSMTMRPSSVDGMRVNELAKCSMVTLSALISPVRECGLSLSGFYSGEFFDHLWGAGGGVR